MKALTAPALLLCPVLAAAAPAQQVGRGHVLYAPNGETTAYLIDENNNTLMSWGGGAQPGNALYFEEDGTLLRTNKVPGASTIGGWGGRVTRWDMQGNLIWDLDVTGPGLLQHHDAIPMPNGNVMILCWEEFTEQQAIDAGRNPAIISGGIFMPEMLLEVQQTGPTTGTVVWEWHAWDHLIQDFDASKANFGDVAAHPELIDINFPANNVSNGDWQHANAIDYDPVHDQILINVPFLHEFWIIDHSTTSAEAAGHTGGNSGMGGDLLYRWGNPQSYRAGTPSDQQLFNQHGAMFIQPGRPGAGNVIVFNNQFQPAPNGVSAIWELERQADAGGNYVLPPSGVWGPAGPTWSYTAPVPTDLFSGFLSSAERLPNGNTLICSGAQAWLFEIDSVGNKVWEFFNPTGFVFHARRYDRQLWGLPRELSVAAGGTQDLRLLAGSQFAGQPYLVLGSAGGTTPGLPIDGETVPLNPADPYFSFTLSSPNTAPLGASFASLDALGRGTASFTLPAGAAPASLVGIELNHAFVVLDLAGPTVALASNAQPLQLLP